MRESIGVEAGVVVCITDARSLRFVDLEKEKEKRGFYSSMQGGEKIIDLTNPSSSFVVIPCISANCLGGFRHNATALSAT